MVSAANVNTRSRLLARYFLKRDGAVVLRQDRARTILRCDTSPDIGAPLFIKIYHRGGIGEALRSVPRGSAGERSYRTGCRLAAAGIPVPEPYGAATERGPLGLASRSLAASVWVGDMVSLRDHAIPLFGKVPAGDPAVRALGRSLGRFIALLHERRIWAPDLNAGNFLVRQEPDASFRVLLADHDDIRFVRTITDKRRLANLSQVAAFLLPLGPGGPDDLCDGYLADRAMSDPERLRREVRKRAATMLQRWEDGMNARFERIADARKEASR